MSTKAVAQTAIFTDHPERRAIMAACAAQVFNNFTPAAWECLVQKAASNGITIDGNSGEASQSGFTIAWNYDPGAQTIQLQCTDSPFWAPCSTINGKIHELVEACM
jgi:hypothetical protein